MSSGLSVGLLVPFASRTTKESDRQVRPTPGDALDDFFEDLAAPEGSR